MREVIGDYQRIEHNALAINTKAREKSDYDEPLRLKFESILEDYRLTKMKLREKDRKELKIICQSEVLEELPVNFFYVPTH